MILCRRGCLLVALVFALAGPGFADELGVVEVGVLGEKNWEQLSPAGKEADAIYGDFVIRNRYLTAVIAQPLESRNANMTVRNVGGALIDLADRDQPSDQLSALYPGMRVFPFRSLQQVVVDGKTVELSAGTSLQGQNAALTFAALAGEKRPAVEVEYRLDVDAPYLTIVTRYRNTASETLTIPLEDDIRADAGKEDMVKSPNGTEPLFWFHDRFWNQAYAVEAPGRQIQANSNSRTSVLKYMGQTGNSHKLEPGQSLELTRRVYVGANLLDVQAKYDSQHDIGVVPVHFEVRDGSGWPISACQVEIVQDGKVRGSGNADANGKLSTALPPGQYAVNLSWLGISLSGSDTLAINVANQPTGNDFQFQLDQHRRGNVIAKVTDTNGKPLPCKIEFRPQGATPKMNFGPETAEFAVGNVCYAPLGQCKQLLPAGDYKVIISHGPEYDAIFADLTVPPGGEAQVNHQLQRTVKTPGWVSSDFHSHSSPSGDNTGSQLGRVLNLVCEHLEFAPCTEHNRISTYQPHIDRLGVQPFVSTISGMELTGQPLLLNHQNVFPLVRKPHQQDGGGPVTDVDPSRQIERAALWDGRSKKLVQQNHPDIGWLFYDRNGDGKRDKGYERGLPFIDVMEIHPVQHALELQPVVKYRERDYANRVFGWLQLLNQGYRIPGVVNTDSHYNFHGSGWLRNWIQSSTDDPAKIDPMEMVTAAKAGRLIMSNGPYLEVSLWEQGKQDHVTSGEDFVAKSAKVNLRIRVQCPNWLDVDQVFVLVNGRKHSVHDYSRKTSAEKFGDGVVKFEETLSLELKGDSHIVVVTGAPERTLGDVMGAEWGWQPPAALSNPIFVDVDGDGFRANGDTLDHPLPVKFGAK